MNPYFLERPYKIPRVVLLTSYSLKTELRTVVSILKARWAASYEERRDSLTVGLVSPPFSIACVSLLSLWCFTVLEIAFFRLYITSDISVHVL